MTFAYTRNKIIFSLFLLIGIACIYLSKFNGGHNASGLLVSAPDQDLQRIRQRGKLIALTDNTSTSFYIYRGDSLGYEYEQLRAFAQYLGVGLQIITAHNIDSVFDQLNDGEVDVIAANLTITQERSEEVEFSEPFMFVPQVLIQRKPD